VDLLVIVWLWLKVVFTKDETMRDFILEGIEVNWTLELLSII
jgi:hypothetical protein